MKFLLDVNVLLAGIWTNHPHHSKTFDWLEGKSVVLCPLAGLGFLRISSNKKAFNFGMDKARAGLVSFCAEREAEWIWDDLLPLDSKPDKSDVVTDFYLADLAAKHGLRFATFDTGIKHSAAELISSSFGS